jgi:hypothetical protein
VTARQLGTSRLLSPARDGCVTGSSGDEQNVVYPYYPHPQTLFEFKAAPQAGVVKELATTTVGAVVQPGTVIVTLLPQDEPLMAEV